ncbi:hypothetical protein WDU94_002332 [Cyamophila willieti]
MEITPIRQMRQHEIGSKYMVVTHTPRIKNVPSKNNTENCTSGFQNKIVSHNNVT